MRKLLVLALIFINHLACAEDHKPQRSGIIGHITITICPVVPPEGCPSRPYQTTIFIFNEKHRLIEQVWTDQWGNFRVKLKPGLYTLVPFVAGPPQDFPYAGPVEVRVLPKRFTPVTINYSVNII